MVIATKGDGQPDIPSAGVRYTALQAIKRAEIAIKISRNSEPQSEHRD